MNPLYAKLSRTSSSLDERNDCSVKALAAVTGYSYSSAHTTLAIVGREYQTGSTLVQLNLALNKYGRSTVHEPILTGRYRGKRVLELEDRLPPYHPYLVHSEEHITAICYGKIVDAPDLIKSPVINIWRVKMGVDTTFLSRIRGFFVK